jgi:hypothetical protein
MERLTPARMIKFMNNFSSRNLLFCLELNEKKSIEINKVIKGFLSKCLLFLPNVRNSLPGRIYYSN